MNRTDRLYGIVEELRAATPQPLPSRRLAERFEVSVRTIERDISALQQTGVPIWSQPGVHGGHVLDSTATLPPLNLSGQEALAIAVALAAMGDYPFAEHGRQARQKLMAVMGSAQAGLATSLAAKLRVVPARPRPRRAIRTAVEQAVAEGRVVHLEYVDRNGLTTQRPVEAHGLYGGTDGWYLIGWCRLRRAGRIFRLDRIGSVTVTDEPVPPRSVDDVLGWIPEPALTP